MNTTRSPWQRSTSRRPQHLCRIRINSPVVSWLVTVTYCSTAIFYKLVNIQILKLVSELYLWAWGSHKCYWNGLEEGQMETYGLERIKWSDFWGRMTWRPEADWNGTIWIPGPSHLLPLLLLFLSSGKEKLLRYPETLHQPWGGADSDGCKRYQRTETRASPLHVCTVYIFIFMLII